jgi:DNA helicase HerA-like ATPase
MAKTTTLIGRLSEVHENGMIATISIDIENGFPVLMVGGEAIRVGQVGSYVRIKDRDIQLIALITNAKEEEHEVRVVLGKDGEGNVKRPMRRGQISLAPVGEIDDQGKFERGLARFPVPGAEVHVMSSGQIGVMFEKYRTKGFNLGYLPSHPSMRVCLDPSVMFGRHVAILGQSGSGKSWGVANILQRAVSVMPKAHIIVLDIHGEYVWTSQDGEKNTAFKKGLVQALDARELEIPYWLLTFAELVDLLIDRDDESATIQIAYLREVVHELRKNANPNIPAAQISIDSPLYFSLDDLFDQFKRANEQTQDFGKTKGPLFGQFDEFLIKLQSRMNDVRYDFLFKPQRRKSSDTLVELLREFVGLSVPKSQISVIDFSSVPFDVRPTVSAQIGRLAFEMNYWNDKSRDFPILLVCEEAHAYIPRARDTQYEGTRRSMERIAKEGRKYGVGLMVVSQRPHELSETVLAQCGSFVCFRMTNPDDQQYIRDLVPDAEADLTNILSTLSRGESLALGEAVPVATRFQMQAPDPTPNSDDVDFYEKWQLGVDDLDVEMIVQKWRRQERR